MNVYSLFSSFNTFLSIIFEPSHYYYYFSYLRWWNNYWKLYYCFVYNDADSTGNSFIQHITSLVQVICQKDKVKVILLYRTKRIFTSGCLPYRSQSTTGRTTNLHRDSYYKTFMTALLCTRILFVAWISAHFTSILQTSKFIRAPFFSNLDLFFIACTCTLTDEISPVYDLTACVSN